MWFVVAPRINAAKEEIDMGMKPMAAFNGMYDLDQAEIFASEN